MKLHSKEHIDMMQDFERIYSQNNLQKEEKRLWPQYTYKCGITNELFMAFWHGYELRDSIYRQEQPTKETT